MFRMAEEMDDDFHRPGGLRQEYNIRAPLKPVQIGIVTYRYRFGNRTPHSPLLANHENGRYG